MNIKYPMAKPCLNREDEKEVMEVLRSGSLSLGPKTEKFEKLFARYLGVRYACAVSSGTAGLHLMLLSAGIGADDEIITTPFSFVASANAILYVGAKPVFADIDPHTFNINPAEIEKKITKKTKAILVVHIFGQPADMDPIMKIARKHKIKILEDACESIGATYKGRKAGTFGEAAVFAFYPNKQMTTGEGGMIVTNSKKIYDMCDSLRNQGRGEDMQWLDHKYLGYNYRMDEMSAALGASQLKRLDFFIKERRKITGWYNAFFGNYPDMIQIPETARGNTHTWFVYVISLKNKNISRENVIRTLKKVGINSKPYLPSIHLLGFYKKQFGYKEKDFPVSEKISRQSLALPLYLGLKKKDVSVIGKEVVSVLK